MLWHYSLPEWILIGMTQEGRDCRGRISPCYPLKASKFTGLLLILFHSERKYKTKGNKTNPNQSKNKQTKKPQTKTPNIQNHQKTKPIHILKLFVMQSSLQGEAKKPQTLWRLIQQSTNSSYWYQICLEIYSFSQEKKERVSLWKAHQQLWANILFSRATEYFWTMLRMTVLASAKATHTYLGANELGCKFCSTKLSMTNVASGDEAGSVKNMTNVCLVSLFFFTLQAN